MIATLEDEGTRYIGAIVVSECAEGNGHMGNLIDAIYDGMPLTAKVSESNPRAMGAFGKYGFKVGDDVNGWQWIVGE